MELFCVVLDYCPLQQGLRLLLQPPWQPDEWVLDYCPLQQGLRPINDGSKDFTVGLVLDYCPLQQGLRLQHLHRSVGQSTGTRLLSITTRIKTYPQSSRDCHRQNTRLLSITIRIIPAV